MLDGKYPTHHAHLSDDKKHQWPLAAKTCYNTRQNSKAIAKTLEQNDYFRRHIVINLFNVVMIKFSQVVAMKVKQVKELKMVIYFAIIRNEKCSWKDAVPFPKRRIFPLIPCIHDID